jgi:uncharacterized membrane protein
MTDFELAIAIHVLSIVWWIGGVAFVTTVLLPDMRRRNSADEALALFETVEHRFGHQARAMTLLAGATGFYMVWRLDLWPTLATLAYWWLDAMIGVWLIFTVLLFIAEPVFLRRWLRARAREAPDSTLALLQRLHWVLLVLSLVTIFGAVAGGHGLLFFG